MTTRIIYNAREGGAWIEVRSHDVDGRLIVRRIVGINGPAHVVNRRLLIYREDDDTIISFQFGGQDE